MVSIFFLFAFLSWSCGNVKVNTFKEYKNWVNNPDNGLIKNRHVKGLTFKVYYRPADYQLLKEVDDSKVYSTEELNKLRESVRGSEYFMMTVSAENTNLNEGDIASNSATSSEYLEKMEELSFGMENRLRLIVEGDTLSPLLFHHSLLVQQKSMNLNRKIRLQNGLSLLLIYKIQQQKLYLFLHLFLLTMA